MPSGKKSKSGGGAIFAGPNLVVELEAGVFYTAVGQGLRLIHFSAQLTTQIGPDTQLTTRKA